MFANNEIPGVFCLEGNEIKAYFATANKKF